MKTIGLIGGVSWESTIEYYRIINQEVRTRLGGSASAKIAMISLEFQEIEDLSHALNWDEVGRILSDAGRKLETAGAEMVLICANTLHRLAPQVQAAVNIPLIHIGEVTGRAVASAGYGRVGLLGTRYTMTGRFIKDSLVAHGVESLVPDEDGIHEINRIIYDELVRGRIENTSRLSALMIIDQLAQAGAEAIILGCTELELLIKPHDTDLPVFDTTELHSKAAVDMAIG